MGCLPRYREQSNAANGLLIDPEGRLVACEGGEFRRSEAVVKGKPRVTRTDLRTGKLEVLADDGQGVTLKGPNDVTIDGRGRLYFTDMAGAAVYRIDAPGKVARILAAPEIQRPNGIQISPDDKTLYLVEANQAEGGARMIRAFDLQPDGTVRNMRVHYNFYPGRSADGMSIDTQGNLYASAGLHQAPRHFRNARYSMRRSRHLTAGKTNQIHPDSRGHDHEQCLWRSGYEDPLRHRRQDSVQTKDGGCRSASLVAPAPVESQRLEREPAESHCPGLDRSNHHRCQVGTLTCI